MFHPTISQEMAKARIANWYRQAERDTLARAAESASPSSPQSTRKRTTRKRIPVRLLGWRPRQAA